MSMPVRLHLTMRSPQILETRRVCLDMLIGWCLERAFALTHSPQKCPGACPRSELLALREEVHRHS